jgi:2-desacetyl-2-hydroxyethyl bacteriochlorophyllide A dehydrogenase
VTAATATMTAAVLADVGTLAVVERPVPAVGEPTDVLLDVEACGICGTDLHILSKPPGQPATIGTVLGHEFVGVIREVGAGVTSLRPGDRVAVAPNVTCGQCVWCRRGLRNHCESWTTHGIYVDGGLAPHVVVPAASCYPISPSLPAHIAALAEPLSTVVHGVRLAEVFPAETAAVIGAGPVGLMFTALLELGGASVIVLEPAERRAALALEMGADRVIDPGGEDPAAVTRELTGGLGADLIVDAVGSQLATALDLVRKAGRIVLFGMNDQARTELAQVRITRDELRLLGAFVGQDVFPDAIRLLEQGRLDFDPLVTHRISLAELPEAVEELRAGRAVKAQVVFEEAA